MRQLLVLLLLIFTVGITLAQAPEIGLLPPQVYVYKQVRLSGNLLVPEAPLYNVIDVMTQFGSRSEPELTDFTNPLRTKLIKKAPTWLKATGAKGVALLPEKELSPEEVVDYRSFHNQSMAMQSGANALFGQKQYDKQVSVYLRESSNKFADKTDRDYLMLIDVFAFHLVKEKKFKEKVDPEKLEGHFMIKVQIIDAATGLAVVVKSKSNQHKKPGRIKEETILKDMEKLVEKAYEKFVKEI